MPRIIIPLVVSAIVAYVGGVYANATEDPPNVILVITDDQGIGDLGCHGNPWIQTPNLDRFYAGSVRLTDFHVTPMCTPTRSGLMTGLYAINNGAWATYKGRDILQPTTPTLAEVFQANGYATGLFGKWHLGDNYPARPMDRGFDLAVYHKSGGVGELSDYWGNDYFDDTYFVNGVPRSFEGYCTDVWFDEAVEYIETQRQADNPFFVYLSTNAPHSPFIVDDQYSDPYKPLVGKEIVNAEFYGMITNIDENFGRLERYLEESGLAENTIVIFMSDNGTSRGIDAEGKLGWNHGYRGRKGSILEGGHRVPFFIRWPGAKMDTGKDINELTSHVDILPTLVDLCGLDMEISADFDGLSLGDLLLGEAKQLPERTLFIHHRQDWRAPEPVAGSCILRGPWRLLNGTELYNVDKDRMQLNNLANSYPELVEDMLKANTVFIAAAMARMEYQEFPYASVGSDVQNLVTLTIQHAIGEFRGIWKVEDIALGVPSENAAHYIRVEQAGYYEIRCRRWPMERSGPYLGIPVSLPNDELDYQAINADSIQLNIGGQSLVKGIPDDAEEVVFTVKLPAEKVRLEAYSRNRDQKQGVYYIYINRI